MLPAPRLEVQCCVWHVTMRLDFRFQTCFAGMKSATVTVIRPLRGSINTKHVRKARWGALPVLLFWAPGSLLTLSLAQHSRADGQLAKKDSEMEWMDWFQFFTVNALLLPFPKISLAPSCPGPETDGSATPSLLFHLAYSWNHVPKIRKLAMNRCFLASFRNHARKVPALSFAHRTCRRHREPMTLCENHLSTPTALQSKRGW